VGKQIEVKSSQSPATCAVMCPTKFAFLRLSEITQAT